MSATGAVQRGIVDTEYYPFIDGLRGVAILAVLFIHASKTTDVAPVNELLQKIISSGARGVQLFFIVSAFTLFSTSFQRFPNEHSPRRNFYIRRAFRILPVWWLSILLYYASYAVRAERFTMPGEAGPTAANVVLHATFLWGVVPRFSDALVPGGWSLFCEETFYILLPVLYLRITSLSRAALLTLGLMGVSICWHVSARAFLPTDVLHQSFLFFFPPDQWFMFGFGILLFYAYRRFGDAAVEGPLALLMDVFAVILVWVGVVGSPPAGPVQYGAAIGLLALCFAASQRASMIRRVIDNAPMRLFGRCCYSIYLGHIFLLERAEPLRFKLLQVLGLGSAPESLRILVWFPVVAAGCVGCGAVSFYLFEKPIVRLGRRVIGQLERRSGGETAIAGGQL